MLENFEHSPYLNSLPLPKLEEIVAEGFRTGKFSRGEVAGILHHKSYGDTITFLEKHQAVAFTPDMLLQDFIANQKIFPTT